MAVLEIMSNNECPRCKDGITINSISIDHDFGSKLTLIIAISQNEFYLTVPEILLNVTGCPLMNEPSPSNYTCVPCNTDYYNINPMNVERCITCDPNNNEYVKCRDGNITIQPDL